MPYNPKRAGTASHKDPLNCRCSVHRARLRKAEAIALAAGIGGDSVGAVVEPPKRSKKAGPINADLEPLFLRGNSKRDRIIQWMSLRAVEPGITTAEVAKRLGIAPRTLYACITEANKEGWLRFENTNDRIEHEIIPKAIQNLSEFLDDKDKSATLETLKGTAFPVFRESKGAGDSSQTVLALKIETSEPIDVKQLSGNIVGKPRELVEEKSDESQS